MLKTIDDVIDVFNDLSQSAYDRRQLAAWVAELEGLVQRELYDPYGARPPERGLRVPPPWDELYILWLRCKTESWNREYSANAYAEFNTLYESFANAWRREHRRAQTALRT